MILTTARNKIPFSSAIYFELFKPSQNIKTVQTYRFSGSGGRKHIYFSKNQTHFEILFFLHQINMFGALIELCNIKLRRIQCFGPDTYVAVHGSYLDYY